jgi:hypothetical protein
MQDLFQTLVYVYDSEYLLVREVPLNDRFVIMPALSNPQKESIICDEYGVLLYLHLACILPQN